MTEPATVTADDVRELNCTAIVRSTFFVRTVGTVLVVIGVVAMAAWLWTAIRTQQELSDARLSLSTPGALDVDLLDRIDRLAQTLTLLVLGSLLVGFGLMIRMAADF